MANVRSSIKSLHGCRNGVARTWGGKLSDSQQAGGRLFR